MRIIAMAAIVSSFASFACADPLPSWNGTEVKGAILGFVESVTDPASEDFVPQGDRIAVFDNDGTLWAEQPLYFQALYALDVLKEKAAADPGILSSDALRAGAEGDLGTVLASGVEGITEVVNVSHAGMSVDAFQADARDWLNNQTHPSTGKRYVEMVYQPMLELLRFLRDEGFTTYIVSGGGVDFIRAFSEKVYGVPPWQVVGSEGNTAYEMVDGTPMLIKHGGVRFIDDKAGKPVGIIRHIGRRPIFAAGNSDGDFEMLEYVTTGERPGFGLLVHHTDATREFAYDRQGHVGTLDRGLDEGPGRGWVIVDMARDWAKVHPGD